MGDFLNQTDIENIAGDIERTGRMDDISHLIKEGTHDAAGVLYWLEGDELIAEPIGKVFPTEEQDTLARMIVDDLNSRFAHGGEWKLLYTGVMKQQWDKISRIFRPHYPTIIKLMWYDADGDHHFNSLCEDPHDVILDNYAGYLMGADQYWHEYQRFINEIIQPRPDQMYRKAKGETPPSQRLVTSW